MDRTRYDRTLLACLLAVRAGLVDGPALGEALRAWSPSDPRGLADVLVEQGVLTVEQLGELETLADGHVEGPNLDATGLAAGAGDASTLEHGETTAPFEPHPTRGGSTVDPPDAEAPTREADRGQGDPPEAGAGAVGDGRFRVLRPHKRGGLGAVSVALDAELNREVALKQILERHADDPVSRSRFLLEAEITGGLEHPGIVPVYGLGVDRSGRPYYAMRFIRGDSLKDAIADHHRRDEAGGPSPAGSRELALRRLLRRFLDVCNAVEYAHRRGVLHRDLKPANVMVGKYGETLVVDWGLAKAIGKPEPEAEVADGERRLAPSHASGSIETLPGAAMGTPAYMSPEQAAGRLDRLGPRSDVYSLGATLYCLLAGRPPFEGPDPLAVIHEVLHGELAPPSKHDRAIDRALEAICLKAMRREPGRRYASAAALAEEVDRWMADEPVEAHPDSPARRAARWGRRHASLVAGAGVALVGAVLALGAVAWLVARHNARLDAARLEAKAASSMAHQAVRTLLSDVVGNDLLNIPGGEQLRIKLAERALGLYRDFVKIHPDDPDFDMEHVRIGDQVAALYRMTGQFDRARVEYDRAIDRLDHLIGLDPGAIPPREYLAYVEGQLAEMIRLAGGADAEAERHYVASIRAANELRARQPDAPRFARLLANASGDYARAVLRLL